MDDFFEKNFGCTFPLLTNKPNETNCILEKSHQATYRRSLSNVVFDEMKDHTGKL